MTREITVKEFLVATQDKQYRVTSSDVKGIYVEMDGSDIPLSYKMDTVEKIVVHRNGNYTLSYGKCMPSYTFFELNSNQK